MKKRFPSLFTLALLSFSILIHSPKNGESKETFKTFPVHLKVDFGSAAKAGYDSELHVEKDTTAKEAVSQVFPILSGKVCCSLRDVMSIDGVQVDPATKKWWICLLNGSKSVSPSRTKLKKGDMVEWKYIQDRA